MVVCSQNAVNCLTPLFSITVICSDAGCVKIHQALTLAGNFRAQSIIRADYRRISPERK